MYVLLLLLLLLLSRLSRVRLCTTSQTAGHQAPPSQGFSRQEHWSRLPFPCAVRANSGPKKIQTDKNKTKQKTPPATSEELWTKTGCWELK